jgi:hypothetical protein
VTVSVEMLSVPDPTSTESNPVLFGPIFNSWSPADSKKEARSIDEIF